MSASDYLNAEQAKADNGEAWNRWAEALVRHAPRGSDRLWTDAIGMTLAEEPKLMSGDIERAITELRAEFTAHHASEKTDVIELPGLPKLSRFMNCGAPAFPS